MSRLNDDNFVSKSRQYLYNACTYFNVNKFEIVSKVCVGNVKERKIMVNAFDDTKGSIQTAISYNLHCHWLTFECNRILPGEKMKKAKMKQELSFESKKKKKIPVSFTIRSSKTI